MVKYTNELQNQEREIKEDAFVTAICAIPPGKVATYGQIAESAGYPRNHRAVARLLSEMYQCDIPWQRVLGAGGEIRISGKVGMTQRKLLKAEGVRFLGLRVDMDECGYTFDF